MMRFGILAICAFMASSARAETSVTLGLASNFSDVSTSTSNPFGNYFRDGVTMALEMAAAKLKAKGLKIVPKEFDYGTSTIKAGQAAADAAASDAIAVIGYNWSSHALIAAPVHQKEHLPMISPSASADRLGRMGAYVHSACFDNSFMAKGLVRVATERLRAKNAAMVVTSDCAYCRDLADTFRRAFIAGGGKIVADVSVLGSDKAFNEAAAVVKNAQPDVIFVPNQELVSARIISAILQAGVRRPFLGGDGWGDVGEQFFQTLGGLPLEGYSVSHWHPELADATSKKFIAVYKSRFNKVPNDTAVLAFDATNVFVEALTHSRTKDRKGIEAALAALNHFEGVTGTFYFNRHGAPSKTMILLKNGSKRFEVVDRIAPVKVEK